MAQLFNTLSPICTAVGHLTLDHYGHFLSSEWHDEVDLDQWRELFRSFPSVETLVVDNGLVEKVCRSLLVGDKEPPQELVPGLKELRVFGGGDPSDGFMPFLDSRLVSGQPLRFIVESNASSESEWESGSDSDW
jgi:hypothetical protein